VRIKTGRITVSLNNRDFEIIFQDVSGDVTVPSLDRIEEWVRSVFEPSRRGEMTIRIVDEPEGADLNERYRNSSGATNVLAFPAGELPLLGQVDLPSIGDLVICAPVIEREAQAQNKPLEDHWAHITIHGTLHLEGFDHMDKASCAVMEARETELLGSLGFDDPYVGENRSLASD